MSLLRKIRSSSAWTGYLLLLGAIVINILVQGGSFFTAGNVNSLFSVNTPLIIAAIAQTIVVLNGGIDLSIGSTITLCNTVAIVLSNHYHWPIATAFLAAIVVGTLIGCLNGLVVAYLRIPSLLATFSTMSIIGGLALIVLPVPGGSIPASVYTFYGAQTFGIPHSFLIVILVALIWYGFSKFRIGKYIRAVGGSEKSAYTSGIRVARIKFLAFTISGFMASIAGLSITALTASGDPKIGLSITLNCIAAVILGGTRLSGGWGGISGSIVGALFLAIVNNIVFFFFNNYMTHINVIASNSSYIQQLLTNTIIILGLASAVFTQRKKPRKKMKIG